MTRRANIRTSGRTTFRRCRRKWNWSSDLRQNLDMFESAAPLWLGTGFHYALEDFHSSKHFATASDAFVGFAEAWRKTPGLQLPEGWEEQRDLAVGMLDYYQQWLKNRDPLKTYVLSGVPQVEVRFEIPLPFSNEFYDEAYYTGTLDRVSIDEHGRLWIVEYKTAKQFATGHFMTDQQITAYCWAASCIYDKPVAGVCYQQHKKVVPQEPEFLKSSRRFSVNKNQPTSHTLYRQALMNLYGSIERAPAENVAFLNDLVLGEGEDQDLFIRRDWVYRNEHQIQAEGEKILMELPEMLNQDLPLYPNPTRECVYDCSFNSACITMDDGGDWEFELNQLAKQREEENDSWRSRLLYPRKALRLPQQKPQRVSQVPKAQLLPKRP